MDEGFAVAVAPCQPSDGAHIDVVGVLLCRPQHRVVDHDVDRARQRRQIGLGNVEVDGPRAGGLEKALLPRVGETRHRIDVVRLGKLDGNRKRHKSTCTGDQHATP